jgi:glycosyltransferase involved in cell wall biosynthesis
MRPFFSVIVCTFNRAHLLPRALDSLLTQTETDWEAIIVDDGSTDGTSGIIGHYAATDARFQCCVHKRNRGLSVARNSGVKTSQGRFITFLDSDDEYAADHLANRRALLASDHSIRFLHGGVKVIGDPFVIDKNNTSRKIHIDECVLGGTFVIRRDVFDVVSGFDQVGYAEDTLFFERVSDAGVEMTETDHPSYIYYRNVLNQMTSCYVP